MRVTIIRLIQPLQNSGASSACGALTAVSDCGRLPVISNENGIHVPGGIDDIRLARRLVGTHSANAGGPGVFQRFQLRTGHKLRGMVILSHYLFKRYQPARFRDFACARDSEYAFT
jgi:hypothetical protein